MVLYPLLYAIVASGSTEYGQYYGAVSLDTALYCLHGKSNLSPLDLFESRNIHKHIICVQP